MCKILDYLNVIKNIKKYISIKKLEQYSKGSNNILSVMMVDILIAVLIVIDFCYICFFNKSNYLKVTGIVLLVLFIIFYIIRMSVFVMSNEEQIDKIKKIMLIDGQGQYHMEWELVGKKSLLIGKKSRNNEVDIDLSSTEKASLVSKQHAVLNFAASNWYIEDVESRNGVGLKKINETSKKRIQPNTPYKLNSGDIIYIANTKLFIK